jgi:hypothetical protein
LVILGAIAYMAILSIGVPAPSTKHAQDKAERKLAYEQTIAEGANRPLAPEEETSADQSWQATVQASEPAPAEVDEANDVTASLDQPETGTEDTEQQQPGTEQEQISMPAEQEASETDMSAAETTGSLPEEQPQEQWVQIAISGASMYASAADDATVLFAFPSGRKLKVVARQEGWLQVTDPQSNTTGWMKAAYLAPVGPTYPQQQAQTYEYRERPNWFRRQREGMEGMINRALGGL